LSCNSFSPFSATWSNAFPSILWVRHDRDQEPTVNLPSIGWTDMVQEIALCALQYKNNLCASSPIPAMAQQCGIWETCMQRDPTIIGRAKVSAELIAEVVNGFVEPISWKTLVRFPRLAIPSLILILVFFSLPDAISGVYPDIAVLSDGFHKCSTLSLSLETSLPTHGSHWAFAVSRGTHHSFPTTSLWGISFSCSHPYLGSSYLAFDRR